MPVFSFLRVFSSSATLILAISPPTPPAPAAILSSIPEKAADDMDDGETTRMAAVARVVLESSGPRSISWRSTPEEVPSSFFEGSDPNEHFAGSSDALDWALEAAGFKGDDTTGDEPLLVPLHRSAAVGLLQFLCVASPRDEEASETHKALVALFPELTERGFISQPEVPSELSFEAVFHSASSPESLQWHETRPPFTASDLIAVGAPPLPLSVEEYSWVLRGGPPPKPKPPPKQGAVPFPKGMTPEIDHAMEMAKAAQPLPPSELLKRRQSWLEATARSLMSSKGAIQRALFVATVDATWWNASGNMALGRLFSFIAHSAHSVLMGPEVTPAGQTMLQQFLIWCAARAQHGVPNHAMPLLGGANAFEDTMEDMGLPVSRLNLMAALLQSAVSWAGIPGRPAPHRLWEAAHELLDVATWAWPRRAQPRRVYGKRGVALCMAITRAMWWLGLSENADDLAQSGPLALVQRILEAGMRSFIEDGVVEPPMGSISPDIEHSPRGLFSGHPRPSYLAQRLGWLDESSMIDIHHLSLVHGHTVALGLLQGWMDTTAVHMSLSKVLTDLVGPAQTALTQGQSRKAVLLAELALDAYGMGWGFMTDFSRVGDPSGALYQSACLVLLEAAKAAGISRQEAAWLAIKAMNAAPPTVPLWTQAWEVETDKEARLSARILSRLMGMPLEGGDPCLVCGIASKNHCSRCNVAAYCSSKCQRIDWPFHKTVCKEGKGSESPAKIQMPLDISIAEESYWHSQCTCPSEFEALATIVATLCPSSQECAWRLISHSLSLPMPQEEERQKGGRGNTISAALLLAEYGKIPMNDMVNHIRQWIPALSAGCRAHQSLKRLADGVRASSPKLADEITAIASHPPPIPNTTLEAPLPACDYSLCLGPECHSLCGASCNVCQRCGGRCCCPEHVSHHASRCHGPCFASDPPPLGAAAHLPMPKDLIARDVPEGGPPTMNEAK